MTLELRRQPPATKVRANVLKPVETGWNIDLHSSPLKWTFPSSPHFSRGRLWLHTNIYVGGCAHISQQKLISYLGSYHVDRRSLDYSK